MLNWRLYPFVKLLWPYAFGVALGFYTGSINILFVCITGSLAVLLGVWAWRVKTTHAGYPLSMALFLAGWACFQAHDPRHNPHYMGHFIRSKPQIWTGILTEKTATAHHYRCVIALETLIDSSQQTVVGKGLLYVPKTAETDRFESSDRLIFRCVWQKTTQPSNPDAPDFSNTLFLQNIHYQCFIKNTDVTKAGTLVSFSIKRWGLRAQQWLVERLLPHLPTQESFAVGTALVLGYKGATTPEVRQAYIDTGSMHILAISGMHILLLFNILNTLFNVYKTHNSTLKWLQLGIALVVIWLFALITGLGGSVLRAVVMATVIGVGKALNARANTYNLLAASAFILLIINPLYLFDIGFQLSYLAVWGILFWQPHIKRLWPIHPSKGSYSQLWRRRAHLKNRWFAVIRAKIVQDLKYYVWEATAIGLAAQWVVTPLSILYFHQFPTYFWVSGLLAVPISTVALVLGLAVCFCGHWGWFGALLGWLFHHAIGLMNALIFKIQTWPYATLEALFLPKIAIILLYSLILTWAYALMRHKRTPVVLPLSIVGIITIFAALEGIKRNLKHEFTVYAVPQQSFITVSHRHKVWALDISKGDSLSQKRRDNATRYHYQRTRIRSIETLNLKTASEHGGWQFYKGLWHLPSGDYCLILTQQPDFKLDIELHTLIISQAPLITMAELKAKFKFKHLVFDLSNDRNSLEKWIADCKILAIPYHNIAEKGAWQVLF